MSYYRFPSLLFNKGIATADTTADGKQAFLVIGDSTQITSDTGAPTPNPGVLNKWNGSNVVNVTTDLDGANPGTFAPEFANVYNSTFGFKSVFIQKAVGGSEFSPNGDTSNWSTTGTLYQDAIDSADACLAALGLTKLKAIFISLGINDARGAVTLTTVETDIQSLFSRLIAKYPGVPILVAQVGSMESATVNLRVGAVRKYLKQIVSNNTDVHFVGSLASYYGAGFYDVDSLHLKITGLNHLARMRVRWFVNFSYSKWARSIISSHFDDLSTGRKNLIETFASTSVYLNSDLFLNLKTTIRENTFLDWAFLSAPLDSGFDFTANDSIASNVTGSKYMRSGYVPAWLGLNTSQNDYLQGVKVKTNSTPAGTAGSIFTGNSATTQMSLEQTATPSILWRCNDATLTQYTTAPDTAFQAESFYAIGRNSGNKYLMKNGVQLATAAVASNGYMDVGSYIGARNNNSVAASIINASFEYAVVYKYTTVTHSTAYTAFEALNDNW